MTRMMTMVLLAAALLIPVTALAQDAAAKRTPVNLNTATVAQLEDLPGIGKATAERIVEYRTKNGGFKKIEDLMNVRGVGEKSFLSLKDLIMVSPPKTEK